MRFFIMFFTFVTSVLGANIEIIPDSKNVIMDEVFGITVKIESKSGDEPVLSMEGNGIDILQKENQGVSSTTTYRNGQLTSKREYIIRYQLKANRTGRISLVKISATSGSETFRHSDIYFSSTVEPENNRNIFVKAEPSKDVIYKGEGVLLRYYLYNKINIATYNIKKFPSLSSFMKRFLQESTRPERINFKGDMYERRILYSMVVYPDKFGNINIDPLVAEVSYPTRSSNSPFNSMGLGIRNYSKKSFSSTTVKVNVMPLPDGAPKGFTGLVGDHNFELALSREKYLVNEPVELKLKVSGQGNLEDYEAPEIVKNENFETFENSANLETTNSLLSTKTFNLTYLPRAEVTLEQEVIPLSYFDPATRRYVSKNVVRPQIIVMGGGQVPSQGILSRPETKPTQQKDVNEKRSLVSPVFVVDSILGYEKIHRAVNFILFSIILIIIVVGLKGTISFFPTDELSAQLKELKKTNLNYKNLYDFLDQLTPHKVSVYKKIEDVELTGHAKKYFKSLLDNKESILYGSGNKEDRQVFREKYFREAMVIIKNNKTIDEEL